MICRICFDEGTLATLVSPCRCIGTSQYIHRRCLDQYCTYYPDRVCRVCRTEMSGPMTSQDLALFAIVLVGLGTTLTGSMISPEGKWILGLALLGMAAYFLRNNFFNQTVAAGTLMVYISFVHGGHVHSVISLVVIVSGIAMITTLFLYVPVLYVMTMAVVASVFAYILIAGVTVAFNSDSYALAVYMCLMYMGWYAWIRTHPPPGLRG